MNTSKPTYTEHLCIVFSKEQFKFLTKCYQEYAATFEQDETPPTRGEYLRAILMAALRKE